MAEESQSTEKPQTEFTRGEEFTSLYANNIQFEWSQFDLKLIFGQLDQSGGKTRVEQHTAMTIPWIQAKLGLYYLQVQVAYFELQNGKIKISQDLIPAEVPEASEEQKQNPSIEALLKYVKTLRDQFVSSL